MVSTCTASASDSSRRLRSSLLVSSSASAMRWRSQAVSAVTPRPSVVDGGVEQLADVAQVGEVALAAGRGQQPGREALGRADQLEERGDAVAAQDGGPAVQGEVHRFPGVVAGGGHLVGRPPEEGGERRGAGPAHRRRPLQRFEQPQPLPGHRRGEHAAGAVDDGGDAHGGEGAPHQVGLPVGADQDGHMPRPDGLVAVGGAVAVAALHPGTGRQQPDEVVGQVVGDHRPGVGRLGQALLRGDRDEPVLPVQDPQPQRRRHRRTRAGGAPGWRRRPAPRGR